MEIPTDNIGETVRVLSAAFPLDDLKRLSQGLAAIVSVYCELDRPRLNGVAQKLFPTIESPPSSEPAMRPKGTRLTDADRAEIVRRRNRGEPIASIADVVGCSTAAVNAVLMKHRKSLKAGTDQTASVG